jgi:hypothetical protein
MALHFGRGIIFILTFCFVSTLHAQTVYYPAQSSDVLKVTAGDIAELFTKAVPGSKFAVQEYTSLPSTGIIFIYDSTIQDQSCKIECIGNRIKFSAAEDAGLYFGIYDYLNELGFRFYLPGTLWEKIPVLSSPYKNTSRTAVQRFKYNTWYVSGGYNSWAMDSVNVIGYSLSKYQRRNNMLGAYGFSGHRGDIFTADYLTTIQDNPCYIASRDGKRKASSQSVPDINNPAAMEYWASTILQRYTSNKKNILGAPTLYKNIYHNFNYAYENIGIEVPDGSEWGNSSDNLGCAKGNYNGNPYPKVSDQQFLLANFTASKINNVLTAKRFQCYAYSGHADVPSANITIDKNIDVQVVASAFQTETSPVGLLNRWYNRHKNISEYDYINLPQWTGETPIFSLSTFKNTLSRVKEKNAQGIVFESSPAKFASLPFLFAGNRYLQYDTKIDNSLDEFTANMFPAATAVHIKQLLNYWGNNNVMSGGSFINDNKFKIPLFLQELNKAIATSQNEGADVMARLQELKAYLHYIVMYYEILNDNKSYLNNTEKAANLCLYLARTNKLQIVNSYFLIVDIVNKFPVTSDFYKLYNVTNGTAYLNGKLSLITNEEIDNNFYKDVATYAAAVSDYKFENPVDIINKMKSAGLKPADKINVAIGYTMGLNYANRSEFYFYAPAPGKVNINCTPIYEMNGYGIINFTVEAVDKPLLVIKDETITPEHVVPNIDITVPYAGLYKLSVVVKFKAWCRLAITTNGNIFFKGAFYGKRADNYQIDSLKSLPKYFYVPNIKELYFSINNACYTNRCLSPLEVQNAFGIKDNNGKAPVIEVSYFDSSLYKISIPSANANSFWQLTRMREYNFCFANISNIQIFAEPKPEGAALTVKETGTIVFPNPSRGVFNFKKNSSAVVFNRINVYDAQGKKIADVSNTNKVDLSGLPAGVYIFSAQKEADVMKGRLIKN